MSVLVAVVNTLWVRILCFFHFFLGCFNWASCRTLHTLFGICFFDMCLPACHSSLKQSKWFFDKLGTMQHILIHKYHQFFVFCFHGNFALLLNHASISIYTSFSGFLTNNILFFSGIQRFQKMKLKSVCKKQFRKSFQYLVMYVQFMKLMVIHHSRSSFIYLLLNKSCCMIIPWW